MSVLLTTTGTVGSVTINDFGGRVFTHPTVNEILSDEFTYSGIRESVDLGVALNSGTIEIVNDGKPILNSNDLKRIEPASENIHFGTVNPVDGTDDNTLGYFAGQRWINTSKLRSFIAINVGTGASVWKEITPTQTTVIQGGTVYDTNSIYITPILTDDVDDFVIPDIENKSLIVWRSDTNVDVTGIFRDSITNWQKFKFANGNTNGKKFKFQKNKNGSAPANRFYSKADVILEEGGSWDFLSNVSLDRWTPDEIL